MKKILLIDNFDSFTYNLVDEFQKRSCQVLIYRNDRDMSDFRALIGEFEPSLLVFSPGPSTPAEAGVSMELIREYRQRMAMFGVCLGHQCMIEAFGGKVGYAGETVHGKVSAVTHSGRGLYEGVPNPLYVGRYHSLAGLVIPRELEITARCGKIVMGIAHRTLPIFGLQYHPESILTAEGHRIFENILRTIEVPHAGKAGKQRKSHR